MLCELYLKDYMRKSLFYRQAFFTDKIIREKAFFTYIDTLSMYMINPLSPVIIFYPKNDLNTVSNLCVQKHPPLTTDNHHAQTTPLE